MTGAGFGGCAVAVVDRDQSGTFVASIAEGYQTKTGLVPQIYVSEATAGAAVMPIDT
jgi:galactokinase